MPKMKYSIDENDCWLWINISPNGYPHDAHRRYYKKFKGEIPSGYQIDHLCRKRNCVNPEHLEAVTQKTNINRGLATKLSDKDVVKIKELSKRLRQIDIASLFEVNQSEISRVLSGERRLSV